VTTFSPATSPPARKRRPSHSSALLRLTLGTRLSGPSASSGPGEAEQAARGSAGRPSSEASFLFLFLFFFILQIYI